MPRYKALIEYDGTKFRGFQSQKNLPTIQNSLEEAIYKLSGERIKIYGAGRTDSGVHALGQIIHFDVETEKFSEFQLLNAINYYLKSLSIIILKIEQIDQNFHARFSAKKRYYRYLILNRIAPPILDMKRLFHVKKEINIENMQLAANYLIGYHDYTSFRAKECQASSPFRTIDKIEINRKNELISIDISAISFLHHMVRNIIGSLIFVGIGKWDHNMIEKILLAKNRDLAGPTAPPYGLYFVKVDY